MTCLAAISAASNPRLGFGLDQSGPPVCLGSDSLPSLLDALADAVVNDLFGRSSEVGDRDEVPRLWVASEELAVERDAARLDHALELLLDDGTSLRNARKTGAFEGSIAFEK